MNQVGLRVLHPSAGLGVADQKQSRVSCRFEHYVVNAAAMRPTAAILKEKRKHFCRPAVGPPRQVCTTNTQSPLGRFR